MEQEVTLLDLLAAFRRAWVGLLLVSLGAGLGVYGVSALLPKRYVSKAMVWLNLAPLPPDLIPGQGRGQVLGQGGGQVLGQGGGQVSGQGGQVSGQGGGQVSLGSWIQAWSEGSEKGGQVRVRWDEKAQVLALEAIGPTPEAARRRAEALTEEALAFLKARVPELYQGLLAAEAARTAEEAALLRAQLTALEPPRASTSESPSPLAPYLEALGVSPPVARSGDPVSTYLGLKRAEVLARLAEVEARRARLEALLRDGALEAFFQARFLATPTLPQTPLAPRPLAYGALASFGVLLLGVLWIFLRELLRPGDKLSQ